jgi:uncharacterized protein (TIGR02186 family)
MFVKYTLRASVLFYATVACVMFFFSGPVQGALTTEVTPQNIPINLFYHGAKLNIKGESNAGDDLIIRISSEPMDAHMKFKGKAAGLFWMKMGDISFEHVPGVYLVASTGNLDNLLQKDELVKEGIGFEAIKASAKVETSAPDMDAGRWIEEFVKFKQAENLYRIQEGEITRPQGTSGNQYQLDIDWPFQAAPGTYSIEVLEVQDGKVTDRSETSLTVARSGIVAQLSNLAFNQPAVYGIIAIVVAMASGFAVGALFKKGGGAH